MIYLKVKEKSLFLMEVDLKVTTKMDKKYQGSFNGKMVLIMKVNLKMINFKVEGYIFGQKDVLIQESGMKEK